MAGICKIVGCVKPVSYINDGVCNMHYHRFRRNGSYEKLPRTRQQRVVMPGRGYVRLYVPAHPLADSLGYVSEHRVVMYEAFGETLPPCELCDLDINWKTVHIDHIDDNASNNTRENLRPLCNACNTRRNYPPLHTAITAIAITYNGETKTAQEWGRDPRVKALGSTIRRRLQLGMSVEDALFGEKKTHNGKLKVDRRPRKTQFKHERKNAIRIEIDGVVKTAAEWSRHPDCNVTEGGIVYRIKAGWDMKRAVFAKSRLET